MKTIYPKITWVNQGELDGDDKRWKGTALGYEMDLRYQWGGKWQGYWTAILNHGAIQTGSGEHGYLFGTVEEAKAAIEAEMRRRIDEKIVGAREVLARYTDYNL